MGVGRISNRVGGMRAKGCSRANQLNRFLAKNDATMLLNLDASALDKHRVASLIVMPGIGKTIK